MCEDKKVLKEERKKAKKMRLKIVGAGNTMESYGDKYLMPPKNKKTSGQTQNKHRNYAQSNRNFDKKTIADKRNNMEKSRKLQTNKEKTTKEDEVQQKM